MASRVAALIVGAGPVGLAAAVQLHAQGLPFRIVEKNPSRTTQSRALVVWPRTLELLHGCGVADKLIAAGLKATGAQFFSRGRNLAHIKFALADTRYPYALMIPQNETERVLEEHLGTSGVALERETELVDFAPEADGVAAKLKSAAGAIEELRADWLIACDGAHSTIRHKLGLPFVGVTEDDQFLLADIFVRGPKAPAPEPLLFVHQDGLMALFPIATDRCRMIASLGRFDGHRPEPDLALVQRLLDERGPGALTASDPVWLTFFRINERKLKDYRAGRIFFAGDAAHVHSPAGGQGMNTGIHDVCNLAWKLAMVARGEASGRLLDSYSAERGAVGDMVLRNAGALTKMATLRNPLLIALRDTAMRLLVPTAFVQARFVRAMTELDIAYPRSPLSRKAPSAAAGSPRPGDRCPDCALRGAAGEPVPLYDLLDARRFTLLVVSERGDRAAPERLAARLKVVAIATGPGGAGYRDATGALTRTFGTRALILVRSDLYLGLIAGGDDWLAVEAYLAGL
jgi:2-polyprenyl-6-methoxyphenol hydroxylase-like FAD-dependent oxidoreductase